MRPPFSSAWAAFSLVNVPVQEVGKKIGGNVQKNIDLPIGGFRNACPIRMSYVLNTTGFPIPSSSMYATVSGADRRQYIYRVNDMLTYLERAFGIPDKAVRAPTHADFAGLKGILVVKGHGWGDARGHVTLWDGARCSDSCHLRHDPDNGPFVPDIGSLWILR